MKILALIMFLLISNSYATDISSAKLVARANKLDSYQLPLGTFLSNATARINQKGSITFSYIGVDNEKIYKAIWLDGKTIFKTYEDILISDPQINDNGTVVFNLYDIFSSMGIMKFEKGKVSYLLHPDDMTYSSYSSLFFSRNESLYFRGKGKAGDRSLNIRKKDGRLLTLAEENMSGEESLSYIFSPQFNNRGVVASKVRLGIKGQYNESRPDGIATWNNQNLHFIAKDKDFDSNSEILSFQNGVSLSTDGKVSFIAKTEQGSILYAHIQGYLHKRVVEGEYGVKQFSNFAPVINSRGDIVFRGKNMQGRETIFIAKNDGTVSSLISEGSLLSTDRENARVMLSKKGPGFSGGLAFNDNNQLVFSCLLEDKYGKESLGTAFYLMDLNQF